MQAESWEVVSLAAGIASVVVCLVAIWLAVQFYAKATESEKGLSNALVQLKAETGLLQRLAGKELARLTRSGMVPIKPSLDKLCEVLEKVGTPPATIVIPAHVLNGEQTREELVGQSVSSCVAAHHFLALCNLLAQLLLATGEDELRPTASRVLDVSYRNFRCFDDILNRVDDAHIKTNPYNGMYQLTCEMFKPRVASASTLSSAEKFFTDFS